MLSPKYLGDQTPMTVKQRMSSLLYSWKVGLPGEPKINDAYQMLTDQGLVFDESAPRDPVSDVNHVFIKCVIVTIDWQYILRVMLYIM